MDTSISTLAIAAALAWASGLRLYIVLVIIGLAGHYSWLGWQMPASLTLLAHPMVIGASGLLVLVEFFADKIPGIDTLWDIVHTFIRIPAGALLAAGVISNGDNAAWALAAALLGGSITAGTHFLKAGGRAAINTSPEPVSNWTASFSEDALAVSGIWLAFQHPMLFLVLLLIFIALAAWMLPKLLRFTVGMLKRAINMASPVRRT